MASAPSKTEAVEAASSVVAEENLLRYQRYVEGGRRYAALSAEALAAIWVQGVREWANDTSQPSPDYDDADAEMALRGLPRPAALAEDEIAAAVKAVDETFQKLPADQQAHLLEVMLDARRAERRRGN